MTATDHDITSPSGKGRRAVAGGRVPLLALVRLALADLKHERLLTLCHVLACAAALAPLLLLFGIQHGAMQSMRENLLQNPRNREIRPVFGQTFAREWLAKLARRDDVAFVIGNIRQIALGVEARRQGGPEDAKWDSLDLLPTGDKDPLLLENDTPIPGPQQCVLSAQAAESLGAAAGSAIEVSVGRTLSSGQENQIIRLHVAGVLAFRATNLKVIYVPVAIEQAVERYKDGYSVPELGWPGKSAAVPPEYDGALVCGTKAWSPEEEAALTTGTGFTESRPVSAEDSVSVLGRPLPAEAACLLLTASGSLVEKETLDALRQQLPADRQQITPYVRPHQATLIVRHLDPSLPVTLLAIPEQQAAGAGIQGPFQEGERWVAYCGDSIESDSAFLSIRGEKSDNRLIMPMTLHGAALPKGSCAVDNDLAGQLNALRTRPLEYIQTANIIRPLRRSYTSFRLYAKSLEAVIALDNELTKSGISVITAKDNIQFSLELDRNLNIIFWIIAAVTVVGGLLSLSASLYASLDRKRNELGMLRLLGVPLRSLAVFPLIQGLTIAALGLAISFCIFLGGSAVIDAVVSERIHLSQHLCSMRLSHALEATAITLGIASIAGLLACARIARQDPAQTMREE